MTNEEKLIDVQLIEEQKNEITQTKLIPMEIFTSDKLNILKELNLIKPDDFQYLNEHSPEFQDRFIKRSIFRSEFEMRYGVLSQFEHPTPDSKYWQAIGEQAVHVQEVIILGYQHKKTMADMEYIQTQIDELEYKLENNMYKSDFECRKIRARLKKKMVEIQEKNFSLIMQRKSAKERMKEIRNWNKIIKELEPQCKYGLEDWEKHHPERYIKRYGERLLNYDSLNQEDKEHVLKHFLSYASAPENTEHAKKYIESKNKNLLVNKNDILPREIGNEGNSKLLERPKVSSHLDYESKEDMMNKDPVTKNFFTRKVRRILVAAPHRSRTDQNVTNFFKVQTPAAFDLEIDQPYGFTVADARNYIVNKAIDEDFDYIFFVDDDVLIPRRALVQLVHHKVDIVGGFYYRKYFPLESVGMHEDENKIPVSIENFKIGDLIHNTLVLPSGCTLFKVDFFKKMEPPWYRTCTVKGRPAVTEDTYLCQKARDLGYDIITDTGIQALHIDKQNGIIYGHPEIVNIEKNQVYEKWREYFAI